MTVDLAAAVRFVTTRARLLDRHRLGVLLGTAGARESALAALEGYRNPDGGYGHGLEPDLRAPESQPAGALHALEVLAEVGAPASPRAADLCDWLERTTLPGGALPFARPVADATGCAPFWAQADPAEPSLHLTSAVVAEAQRVARHDAAVAGHPWMARATRWCLDAIAALDAPRSAYELSYVLGLLDLFADRGGDLAGEATHHLDRLAGTVPASGVLPVEGGTPDEVLHPLDWSPLPDRPLRRHVAPGVIAADLERLAEAQTVEGGWEVDYESYSPAAALEWEGYATVGALRTLAANGIAIT